MTAPDLHAEVLAEIRALLVATSGRLRAPMQQSKSVRAHGTRVQVSTVPAAKVLTADDLARLTGLRDALRAAAGVRLQDPVMPARTSEQEELEMLRAQLARRDGPVLSAAEDPSVGGRA